MKKESKKHKEESKKNLKKYNKKKKREIDYFNLNSDQLKK